MIVIFPEVLGEVTPTLVAFVLGVILGTQMEGKISSRTTALVLFMGLLASILFEAPIHFWSVLGGVLTEQISFAFPFISATIGILLGKSIKKGGGSE
ncbi:MAG: hypothetical protein QFX35_02525 [Candidatus Verstraetearchaeota archaeon]|nr:hypothetical protein [Candidatus Verstraetearchaeota archaeon]